MLSAPSYIFELAFERNPQFKAAMVTQSPCTRVCSIDSSTGLCVGCARSIAEIAAWARMTEEERQRIMLSLSDRRRQAGHAAGR